MDDSITVTAAGSSIATSGTSARAAIPKASSGEYPRYIRVAATVAASVRLGVQAIATAAVKSAAGTGYVPADTITLTGGTFSAAGVLTVSTTKIISAAVNAAGTGYAPADTITLAGGTFTTAGVLTVTHTKAVSAAVVAGGTGGTPGAVTITGTTGTGTKFQATGTINGGGVLTGALVVTVAGDYTVNPTSVAVEPVTGGGLTGCTVILGMGVLTTSVTTAGAYTVNTATFTQGATSGSGTGATFNTAVYGVDTVAITTTGNYSVLPSNAVAQGSTSGVGTGATFTMSWSNSGIVATTSDTQIQPGDSTIIHVPTGITDIAAIQVSAGGTVQISPLENM